MLGPVPGRNDPRPSAAASLPPGAVQSDAAAHAAMARKLGVRTCAASSQSLSLLAVGASIQPLGPVPSPCPASLICHTATIACAVVSRVVCSAAAVSRSSVATIPQYAIFQCGSASVRFSLPASIRQATRARTSAATSRGQLSPRCSGPGAGCCNTRKFPDFVQGHWLRIYATLWPGSALPDDVPNARTHAAPFWLSHSLAFWISND